MLLGKSADGRARTDSAQRRESVYLVRVRQLCRPCSGLHGLDSGQRSGDSNAILQNRHHDLLGHGVVHLSHPRTTIGTESLQFFRFSLVRSRKTGHFRSGLGIIYRGLCIDAVVGTPVQPLVGETVPNQSPYLGKTPGYEAKTWARKVSFLLRPRCLAFWLALLSYSPLLFHCSP